jgi:hypothetical protein
MAERVQQAAASASCPPGGPEHRRRALDHADGLGGEGDEAAGGDADGDDADDPEVVAGDCDTADGSGADPARAAAARRAAPQANLAKQLTRTVERSQGLIQRYPEGVSVVHMVYRHGHQQRAHVAIGGMFLSPPEVKKQFIDLFIDTLRRDGNQGIACLTGFGMAVCRRGNQVGARSLRGEDGNVCNQECLVFCSFTASVS